jgi:hypothetical protein
VVVPELGEAEGGVHVRQRQPRHVRRPQLPRQRLHVLQRHLRRREPRAARPVKRWSNAGQTLVKRWPNAGQSDRTCYSPTCAAATRRHDSGPHWTNTDQCDCTCYRAPPAQRPRLTTSRRYRFAQPARGERCYAGLAEPRAASLDQLGESNQRNGSDEAGARMKQGKRHGDLGGQARCRPGTTLPSSIPSLSG